MLEWNQERFQEYCEYCEECLYNVYQQWLQDGGQDDDHQRPSENWYKVCPEYNTCSQFKTICDDEMQVDYEDYFECTEVEANNGRVAYIGPHCLDDGFTISLGVYADQYCNEYIGNGVNIAKFLGEDINETVDKYGNKQDVLKSWYNSANGALDILDYSDEQNVCIPCRKAVSYHYTDTCFVPLSFSFSYHLFF